MRCRVSGPPSFFSLLCSFVHPSKLFGPVDHKTRRGRSALSCLVHSWQDVESQATQMQLTRRTLGRWSLSCCSSSSFSLQDLRLTGKSAVFPSFCSVSGYGPLEQYAKMHPASSQTILLNNCLSVSQSRYTDKESNDAVRLWESGAASFHSRLQARFRVRGKRRIIVNRHTRLLNRRQH